MRATVINGRDVAKKQYAKMSETICELKKKNITPCLAIILAGDDPASVGYVSLKERTAKSVGVDCRVFRLPADVPQCEIEGLIDSLNKSDDVHGIMVQLPLPAHIDANIVLELIIPEKDVDGFHLVNSGKLTNRMTGITPCTPRGIMELIAETGCAIAGKHAVIVGRSMVVGTPLALLLLNADATVTVCHSKTVDLASYTHTADILVSAVGCKGLIRGDMVKEGAIVVDVGNTRVDGKVWGDVRFDEVSEIADFITPVPGGVGPMTIAMLIKNTIEAACDKAQ